MSERVSIMDYHPVLFIKNIEVEARPFASYIEDEIDTGQTFEIRQYPVQTFALNNQRWHLAMRDNVAAFFRRTFMAPIDACHKMQAEIDRERDRADRLQKQINAITGAPWWLRLRWLFAGVGPP